MTIYESDFVHPKVMRSKPRLLAVLVFGIACIYPVLSPVAHAREAKKSVEGRQSHQRAGPPVAAEDTEVYVIKKVKDETKEVTAEISQKNANVTALSTEVSLAQKKGDDFDHQARALYDSAEGQKLRQDAAEHDAACAGKVMQPAEYSHCEDWKNSVQARVDRQNEMMIELHRQFVAQQEEVARRNNELVLAKAAVAKLQNYLSWLTAADSKLSTSLAKSCKNMSSNATLEELKHRCGNIQFDAASVGLPPCETERCQGWVMYAKPQRTPEQAIQDYKNSGKQNPTPNPLLDKKSVPPPPNFRINHSGDKMSVTPTESKITILQRK